MARNTNPWIKFFTRDWMESERIMSMSCAAEGVYIRCLAAQGIRGNIPADLAKLARVLNKPLHEIENVWHEVVVHFSSEQCEGEDRFFNEKLREQIEEDAVKSKNYSKAHKRRHKVKSSSNLTQTCDEFVSNPPQKPSVSVSVSVSDSVSDSVSSNTEDLLGSSGTVATPAKPKKKAGDHLGYDNPQFCEFMDLWPRKNERSAAYRAYLKQIRTPELHEKLIRRSREAVDGILSGRETDKIKYPAAWINCSDWIDEKVPLSVTRFTTPPRGVQSFQKQEQGTANYAALGSGWGDAE